MNCATITPDERYAYDKERSHDRRTSRGLTSCLRGESEEYYDFEAEGKDSSIFHHIQLHLAHIYSVIGTDGTNNYNDRAERCAVQS